MYLCTVIFNRYVYMAEVKDIKPRSGIYDGDLSDLVFDDKNFNLHTKQGKDMLRASLSRHKFGRSVLVDKNNRLIGGNGIVETAAELDMRKVRFVETTGDELIVVKRNDVDLDSAEGRDMAFADNATAAADLAWNEEMMREVQDEYPDLSFEDWGVELPPLDDVVSGGAGAAPSGASEDDYDDAEREIPTCVRRGDRWRVGRHHLMCGDSASDDVALLMAGQKADLCLSDPPFGNNMAYGRNELGEQRIKGDADTELLFKFFAPLDAVMKDNTHSLIWIQWRTFSELVAAFSKYKLRTVVIWDKMQPGLGAGFTEQYEMLCVFIKGDAKQNHFSGNVWQVPRVSCKRTERLHPHRKPVEVLTRALDMCSKPGDVVLDLFGGSGSTLIACEQFDRQCYMMELDEHYASVILDRYINFTGSSDDIFLLCADGSEKPYAEVVKSRCPTAVV